MTCTDVQARELAERYVRNDLSEAEREEYELHFFECERCHAEVETIMAVRDALAHHPQPSLWIQSRGWLALAAALVLVVSAAVGWLLLKRDTAGPATTVSAPAAPPATATPVAELAQLAVVEPPPYEPRRFRGGSRAAFTAGMERYLARDYAAAIGLLERATRDEPEAEDAAFYLGASYLLENRAADAARVLSRFTSRPESDYAESAQFLLANAALKSGNPKAALRALDATIAFHGDYEAAAQRLRERLTALVPARVP
jgi:TolA-binding protein